jgi:phosphoenolpyruvate-protein phosphotransferase
MAHELRGVAAAPGVAIAAPWIHRPGPVGAGERRSLDEAAAVAASELESLAQRLRASKGVSDEAAILEAQALMGVDEELLGGARRRVADGSDPYRAILAAGDEVAAVFAAMDDELLAARAADVRDVAARIARHVIGAEAPRLERPSIAVAADLAPSVTVELDRALLAGIALEGGSRTSHAAILARALGIPAVVGVPGLLASAASADALGIDGEAGRVILDPDDEIRAELGAAARRAQRAREENAAVRSRPLATADGHRVRTFANVGDPSEVRAAFEAGAEGIGLFRTEFAFAGRRTPPTEEEQTAAYAEVFVAAAGRPVVLRLADIGGDKPLPYVSIEAEANPFLGVRAIRLADGHPDLYPTQVRAILRASAETDARAWIMAPMVADIADVDRLRSWVADACAAVPDAPAPRVGIMVEVPSAVTLADQLAPRVDFMSIGTNDLTQYLLAADRTNPALADRQDGLHPAVLRAVAGVVAAARDAPGVCDVAVCGELAGDPIGAQVLVGLGVAELSMGSASFGSVNRAIAARTRRELEGLATSALASRSAAEVRALVEDR